MPYYSKDPLGWERTVWIRHVEVMLCLEHLIKKIFLYQTDLNSTFFISLKNFVFNWRIIDLQNFVVFYQTSTWISHQFSSVQFSRSVVSDSLRPHESQHDRPLCPSQTPGVYSDSRPSSQWCHPAISSLSSPSPPATNPSQHQSLFQRVNSSHEVAKVLEFQL